jgi:Uma2 family endonuclease
MSQLDAEVLTTRAAEGVPRRAFSVADVERMVEVGLIDPHERLEIIGGEIVPMSPKGNHHEVLRVTLADYWGRRLPAELIMAQEPGLRLNKKTYVEPDFIFYPRSVRRVDIKAQDIVLLVEIADTSLSYDQTTKAQLYSSFGLREYWTINAVKLTTRIHRDPAPGGYRDVQDYGPKDRLAPIDAPSLALNLSDLEML